MDVPFEHWFKLFIWYVYKDRLMNWMQRARMISIPLPKGTKSDLRLRDWGIERSYTTSKGNEISTAAPYENSALIKRKFKILTSDLINLGYIGWFFLVY